MAMSAAVRRYTADDLDEMPDDGNRYEVIDGVLFVTPAPALPHQLAQMELITCMLSYAIALDLQLLAAPTAVRASRVTEVEPDLLALPRSAVPHDGTRYLSPSSLLLAVEILSPSTELLDRNEKRRTYLEHGVAEYWIVDLAQRAVEVWRPGAAAAELLTATLLWHPVTSHPALAIDLVAYFARVLDPAS
jgi:Uma2 family endonuclease